MSSRTLTLDIDGQSVILPCCDNSSHVSQACGQPSVSGKLQLASLVSAKQFKRLLRQRNVDAYVCFAKYAPIASQVNSLVQQQLPKESVKLINDVLKSNTHLDQLTKNKIVLQRTVKQCFNKTVNNQFYLDSYEGREAYPKQYMRTTLHLCGDDNLISSKRNQLLMCNEIHIDDVALLRYLDRSSCIFVGNIIVVPNVFVGQQVMKVVQQMHNMLLTSVTTIDGQELMMNKCDVVKYFKDAGSPKAFLIDWLHREFDLPSGSQEHLESATPEVKPYLRNILKDYSDVFPTQLPKSVPPDRGVKDVHHIPLLPNVQPPVKKMYRQSPAEQLLIKEQIEELCDAGLIRPSQSPFGAPVLFVKKPDGSLRFCVDYRALNKLSVKDKYPLPHSQDLIDQLKGAKYFTGLDLRSGYWQLKIAEEDVHKTAFICRQGQYEWLVMPFGLTNAPSTFMRCMNTIFRDMLDKCVVVFLDDILIYSHTLEEHDQHVRQVLDRLRKYKFWAKLKKCEFFLQRVTFLGFDISADGMNVNPKKVAAVKEWPTPANVRDVRSFLGFVQFYRKFIKDFAKIAAPLTELTKDKVKFTWSMAQQSAFDKLKDALTNAPVMKLIDLSPSAGQIELHTDASSQAVGAVLHQWEGKALKPIAYHSRKLKAAEMNYSTTDREMLAIIDACRVFRHYLEGVNFVIKTDHAPLREFLTQPTLSRRQARWLEKLAEFQPGLKIEYLKGKENIPADSMTRRSDYYRVSHLSISSEKMLEFQRAQQSDIVLKDYFELAKSQNPDYRLQAGVLYRYTNGGNKLIVPRKLVNMVMAECHDHAGHTGIVKTTELVKRYFWWPNLAADTRRYVRECHVCQQNKFSTQRSGGMLSPLPVPSQPWSVITMDFITDLPKTHDGNVGILTVVDKFSKMAHYLPTREPCQAPDVAKLFLENIVRLHGLPKQIISDRDTRFLSHFWKALMKKLGVSVAMSSAFHPQTDGQSEKANQVIEQMLRCYCSAHTHDWDQALPYLEYHYNNSYNTSTHASPFFVCYGYNPSLGLTSEISNVDGVEFATTQLQQIWDDTKHHLQHAQEQQAKYANRQRRHVTFQLGDKVLLSTGNLNLPAYHSRKLMPRYIGPFEVIQRVGNVAYRLQLPPQYKMHNVFHVSLLKPYVGTSTKVLPDPIVVDDQLEYEVEALLKHRGIGRHRQYLVQWKGYPLSEASWEPESNLENAQLVLQAYKKLHSIH